MTDANSPLTPSSPLPGQLKRVRKAYEQVADQLREAIVTGAVRTGQRLPTELELADQFGVSRATIREALRVLAAEGLTRTVKGIHGGSFIARPTVDHISEFVSASIGLLTQANDVTLDELLEARMEIEVPAARLSAERRSADDLERLHAQIPGATAKISTAEQFVLNKGFHSALVESAGNPLLTIAAQPIFVVLQTNLARSALTKKDHKVINDGHVRLHAVIEAGDAEGAAREMRRHLEELRPLYQKAWKTATDGRR